jgi:hypothetical protein
MIKLLRYLTREPIVIWNTSRTSVGQFNGRQISLWVGMIISAAEKLHQSNAFFLTWKP